MNLSNIASEDFCLTAKAPSPTPKPAHILDDLDDDIYLLTAQHRSHGSPPTNLLPDKRHPVLDVDRTVVSTSLIRRIEYELRNDKCDPRTIFNCCRGLTKGSLEFEDAYIAARIRSFAKHQRIATDPIVGKLSYEEEWPVNSCRHGRIEKNPPASHPMAVNHLGHLMSHLGIWVIGLLGIQFFAAWRIGAFADTYLEGGRIFYFLITIFLFLAINSFFWFRRRGKLCDAFLFPGVILFLLSLLPVLILHVRETILAM